MVRTRADHLVLWPSYFDSTRSKARGRRVPRSMAVQNPTSEEILVAVKALGLKAELHKNKSYPASWWNREGCVSVEKKFKKTELISKVAPALKRFRQ